MAEIFAQLRREFSRMNLMTPIGRVSEITAGALWVEGLQHAAALGDRVQIGGAKGPGGEIISISSDGVKVISDHGLQGLSIGLEVALEGPATLSPAMDWIGRVIDPLGRPLDGRPLFAGERAFPLLASPPAPAKRRGLGDRLSTGKAVFNTLLPIVRGQRIGLFAGSGVGKSTLLGSLASQISVDVVVIALIGERGRELREFTENVLGKGGMARSVVIAATSDQSALLRRRCAQSAMTVAEYFRN